MFFQLRFGFLKLKLQLTLKQTNIRNGTPPVSHQSFRRFNYLFFPPVMRLQIHCLDVPIAPAKRKKTARFDSEYPNVLFSKWQFLNWDFKKSDQTIFWAEKKNMFGTVQDCMPTLSNTLLTPKLSFHVAAQVCCAGLVASGGLVNLHITL